MKINVGFKIITVGTSFSIFFLLTGFADGHDHSPGSKIYLASLKKNNENLGSSKSIKRQNSGNHFYRSEGNSELTDKFKPLIEHLYDRHRRELSYDSKDIQPYRERETSPQVLQSRKVRSTGQKTSFKIPNEVATGDVDSYKLGFNDEFNRLQSLFIRLQPNTSFASLYESLWPRIEQYAKPSGRNSTSQQSRIVLRYLYTAALSKICSINNNTEENLVVNPQKYLDIVKKDVEELKDSKTLSKWDAYKVTEIDSKQLEDRIEDAQNFLDKHVDSGVNILIEDIDEEMKKIINEPVLQSNSVNKQAGKLEDALAIRAFLGITKVATEFLGYVGHLGKSKQVRLESLLRTALDGQISEKKYQEKATASLAAANKIAVKISAGFIQKGILLREQLSDVAKQLNKISGNQASQNLAEIRNKISATQKNIQQEIDKEMSSDLTSRYKIHEIRKELNLFLETKTKYLEDTKAGNDKATKEMHNILKFIKVTLTIDSLPIDVYGEVKNDKTKIEKVANAMEKANAKIKTLSQYEQSIYETIHTIMKSMKTSVKITANESRNKTGTLLDVSFWQVRNTIQDVKFRINQMAEGFKIEENLIHHLDQLKEGMSIMIEVYNRIEHYRDNVDLVDSITDLTSRSNTNIRIENRELNDAVNYLQKVIHSNLVLINYERGVNVFKQHIFPFTSSYSPVLRLPPSTKANDTDDTITHAVNNLQALRNSLKDKNDKLTHRDISFSSRGDDLPPFYVWKYESIKSVLPKLFEGKEVVIKSGIRQGIQKNAIKFNVIAVRFKLENKTLQRELDTLLNNFEIQMTHLGNSYYRCDSKVYVIPSAFTSVYYSFMKKKNGEPVSRDGSYVMLKKNTPLLSPYAMWSLKLYYNDRGNFSVLAPYKTKVVDIELEGRGQYVDLGVGVCSDDLNNDYKLDSNTD